MSKPNPNVFWEIPNTLTNHFTDLTNPSYKTSEISYLIRSFGDSSHVISEKIQHLLVAVNIFRSATNPDFKKVREETKPTDGPQKIFDEMGSVLATAISESARENKGTNELLTYNQAILYAIASINERLERLKNDDDKLYTFYTSEPNKLKTAMQANTPKPPL